MSDNPVDSWEDVDAGPCEVLRGEDGGLRLVTHWLAGEGGLGDEIAVLLRRVAQIKEPAQPGRSPYDTDSQAADDARTQAPTAQIIDLMEALRASLALGRGKKGDGDA